MTYDELAKVTFEVPMATFPNPNVDLLNLEVRLPRFAKLHY
jgi:hypothetical protein